MPDVSGLTALHEACHGGYVAIAKDLVAHMQRADAKHFVRCINAKDKGGATVLHYAARCSNAKLVQFLLSQEARIDAVDQFRCSPLHYAAEAGAAQSVDYLIRISEAMRATQVRVSQPRGAHAQHAACGWPRGALLARSRPRSRLFLSSSLVVVPPT